MSTPVSQVVEDSENSGSTICSGSSALQGASPAQPSLNASVSSRWAECLGEGSAPRPAQQEILIGVLPGEGIGPEVVRCALEVLRAVAAVTGLRVRTQEGGVIGRDAERSCGATLPEEAIQFCKGVFSEGGAILNGPGGGRYVYDLRRQFDLFFKISPLRTVDGVPGASRLRPEALANVDILVTRENTGGVYQGACSSQQESGEIRVAGHSFSYSESQVCRFLEASARLAAQRRGSLTVVWKESGVPAISELWRDCAHEVARSHGVQCEMVDIDLMAYRLIQDAPTFDVVAAPNLFGDVLADLGAVLLGSRGVSYSGNFTGTGRAVYQTNHGAAYHLAGSDQANPGGQILSLAMMLRESFGLSRESSVIEEALRSVWKSGWRTVDVAGNGSTLVSTSRFAAQVAKRAAASARETAAQEAQGG